MRPEVCLTPPSGYCYEIPRINRALGRRQTRNGSFPRLPSATSSGGGDTRRQTRVAQHAAAHDGSAIVIAAVRRLPSSVFFCSRQTTDDGPGCVEEGEEGR